MTQEQLQRLVALGVPINIPPKEKPIPQSIVTLIAFGDSLRATPRAWAQLDATERGFLELLLLPQPAFTEEQRAFVQKWWLLCGAETVAQINALLPANVRVATIEDVNGNQLLSCDLLSDSKAGQTYAAARGLIEGLTLVYRVVEDFPVVRNN